MATRRDRAVLIRRLLVTVNLLAVALAGTAVPAPQARAAGPRPDFRLPLPCNTSWPASTYDSGTDGTRTWSHLNFIDITKAGAAGTPVLASAAGYARLTNSGEGQVIIDHGSGWTTVYQHMTGITVTSGGRNVGHGEQIGVIGAGQVGTSTGPHLHYAQRADGAAQPPAFTSGTYNWGPGSTYVSGNIKLYNDRASTNQVASDNCGAPPPPPPPPDNDADGVPNTTDLCPHFPGPPGTRGCPPEDFDTSGRVDANGDGRSDAVAFYDYGGSLTKGWLFQGTTSGVAAPSVIWDSGAGNWDVNRARFVSGDFNGDARTDIAAFYDYGGSLARAFVFKGAATGLTAPGVVWDSGAGNWDLHRARFVSGDFNGDGRTDVTAFYDYGGSWARAFLFKGTSAGLTAPIEMWSSGPGQWDITRARFVSGDFNGDGRTDVTAFYDYGGSLTTAWLFKGSSTGLGAPAAGWSSGAGNWDINRARFVSGDMNGDGRTDVAAFYDYGGSLTGVFLFNGAPTGVAPPVQVWNSGTGNWDVNRARFVSGDVNGDGRTDVTAFYDYGGSLARAFVFKASAGGLSAPAEVWSSGPGQWDITRARFVSGGAFKGLLRVAVRPSISGTRRVGATLTANRGSWFPGGLTFRYQWRANGVNINGATSTRLFLRSSMRGKRITVLVRASRPGYVAKSAISVPTAAIR